jgi:4-nitrophenyl phosphatase
MNNAAVPHPGERAILPVRGLLFDLDGTLLLSDRSLGAYDLLPSAAETLLALKQRQFPFAVLTNGSAYAPAEHAARLRSVGLPVDDEQMFTPSSVAADHMVRHGVKRVLVLGSRGVGQALREGGIETTQTGDMRASEVDAVYVGWHPDCRMTDIEAACQAIWAGAKLYVASDVPFFATKQGRTIGYSFAIVGAIRRMTRTPMILTGKPSLRALRFVSRKLAVPMRYLGVVGDDPVVETIMALRGKARAFAVTTGTTNAQQWQSLTAARQPHQILTDLRELLDHLEPTGR